MRETPDRPTLRTNDETFAAENPGEALLTDRSALPFDWMDHDDDADAFAALRALTPARKKKLFAACIARSVKGQLSFEPGARPELEATVARLDVDFAGKVRPSADIFWTRINKGAALDIARSTLGIEWAAGHSKDKKPILAAAMERAFGTADDVPAGITPEGRSAALAWVPPGFAPFDTTSATTEEASPSPDEQAVTTAPAETGSESEPAATADPIPGPDPVPVPGADPDPAPTGEPEIPGTRLHGITRAGHRRRRNRPGRPGLHHRPGRRPRSATRAQRQRRRTRHCPRQRPRHSGRRVRDPGIPAPHLTPPRLPHPAAQLSRCAFSQPIPGTPTPMTLTAALPDSITAHVASSAIDKVTRFFNATLSDAFVELLQNSRRSNSTRIAVTVDPLQHGEHIVIVPDDGRRYLPTPRCCSAFGRSGWDRATAPTRGPPPGSASTPSHAWAAPSPRDPTPASPTSPRPGARRSPLTAFSAVPARPSSRQTKPPTRTAPRSPSSPINPSRAVRTALAQAARHYPLTVQFNGEPLPRKAFLDGAIYVERWKGLVFGVFPRPDNEYHTPALNFHGLTVRAGFPSIGHHRPQPLVRPRRHRILPPHSNSCCPPAKS